MAKTKTNTILIRHGRSENNINFSKELDSPLTGFGVTQAVITGKFLKNINLEGYTFYVSPFIRCLSTAFHICTGIGKKLNFIVDPLYVEYLPRNSNVEIFRLAGEFPDFDWSRFNGSSHMYYSENDEAYLNRTKKAYESLADNSLVVSHGLTCIALGKWAQGEVNEMPNWDYSINNCSLTWLVEGKVKWWGRNLHHEIDY